MSNWTNKKAAFSFPEEGYPGMLGRGGTYSLPLASRSGASCHLYAWLWAGKALYGDQLTLPSLGGSEVGENRRSPLQAHTALRWCSRPEARPRTLDSRPPPVPGQPGPVGPQRHRPKKPPFPSKSAPAHGAAGGGAQGGAAPEVLEASGRATQPAFLLPSGGCQSEGVGSRGQRAGADRRRPRQPPRPRPQPSCCALVSQAVKRRGRAPGHARTHLPLRSGRRSRACAGR